MKKKRTKKRQFGGFNLPPSMMGLFTEGAPSFDQVMNLAPQLDSGAGTDVFSRAFAEDNPDLIAGDVWWKGAMAQANQDNPGQDPAEVQKKIDQQVMMYERQLRQQASATGAGPFASANVQHRVDQYRKQLEENAAQQASAHGMITQLKGVNNLVDNTNAFVGASNMFGMLDSWYGQQGGTPFEGTAQPDNGKVTWDEALQLTAEDNAFITGLKDDKTGRGYVMGLLQDMGFEAGQDAVKKYKEIQGLNVGPTKGADNKIDKGFLEYLAGHYKSFQFEQWGLDPRELKKMQDGGKAILGYSDNSPYKYLPEITIPGNNITMENTGTPLVGIPDVGDPRMMEPYSGTHIFPGASKVKEMPVMKKGGRKKMRRVPYYQPGGPGQEAAVPPVGVQLELDEIFLTPELDIIDTNAREKHKNMEKDVITDVMRPDDYVVSADPSMNVTRERLEDVSFGLGPVHYKEGEIGELPEEITAASILPDDVKEIILADYGKAVRKTFPMSNRDDMFSRKTNDANKSSRIPYLSALTLFNEEKRTKGKSPMTGFATNFENRFEDSYTSGAGVDMDTNQHVAFGEMPSYQEVPEGKKGGNMVPHGQFGLDIVGSLIQLGTAIFGAAKAGKNKKIATQALEADRPQINQLARTEGLHSDLSYGAQMAGLSSQDPTVNAPQYDPTQLDSRKRNISPALFNIAAARAMAGNRPFLDAAFKNTSDFSEAVNAYSPLQAASMGTLADLGMSEVEKNLQLENEYRDRRQDFNDRQELADVTAQNATRTNANQLTGALGNTLGSSIASRGRIAASRINALRSNSLQTAQAKIDGNTAIAGAVQNVGAAAANAGYTYEAGRSLNDSGVNNNVTFRSDSVTSGSGSPSGSGMTSGNAKPLMTPDGRELWPVWKDGKIVYVEIYQ